MKFVSIVVLALVSVAAAYPAQSKEDLFYL